MDANEYQQLAMRTAVSPSSPANAPEERLLNAALGLCGEGGEFADTIKKWRFHGHQLDTAHLRKELGDIAWYVALACEALGTTLGQVMAENVEKLRQRYPDGFDPARSQQREPERDRTWRDRTAQFADGFDQAITELQANPPQGDPRLVQAELQGMISMRDDLREQVAAWDQAHGGDG